MLMDEIFEAVGMKKEDGKLPTFDEIGKLPEEILHKLGEEAEKRIRKRFDKKPEDYTVTEKLSCAQSLKVSVETMPLKYAWLADIFLMSMCSYISTGDRDFFCKKMEWLAEYILDYRIDLGGKEIKKEGEE